MRFAGIQIGAGSVRAIRHPFNSMEELHAERLECFRVMWHRELGVAAALQYCTANNLPIPQWAGEEVQRVLANALSLRRKRLTRSDQRSEIGRASCRERV